VDSFSQLSPDVRSRLRPLLAVRDLLARHRMRGQLISAIELQMAVFLLGPALDLVMPVTVVAGALLLAFEVAMIVQFWLSARAFSRQLAG
jgi:hypothetical protein